jgi:hypothetical protein
MSGESREELADSGGFLVGQTDGVGIAEFIGESCPLFALGPDDLRWGEILERNPHLRPAVESGVCVVVDGVAVVVDEARADQLRAAGNGVVALQAAVAFSVLLGRFL